MRTLRVIQIPFKTKFLSQGLPPEKSIFLNKNKNIIRTNILDIFFLFLGGRKVLKSLKFREEAFSPIQIQSFNIDREPKFDQLLDQNFKSLTQCFSTVSTWVPLILSRVS